MCVTGSKPGLELSSQLVAWPQPGPEKQLPFICLWGTFQIHSRLASPGFGLPSLELFIMDSRATWNCLEEVGCESRLCGLRVGEPCYLQNLAKGEIECQHFPAGGEAPGHFWSPGLSDKTVLVVRGRKGGVGRGHSLLSAGLWTDLPPKEEVSLAPSPCFPFTLT